MSLQNKFLSKELSDKFWKEGLTLATAESCTAGNIAAVITAIPGSSHFYKGGIVAYSDEVKTNLLGVTPETLEKYGAVSEETVIEMVKGAMKSMNSDCAVATSGIAGPTGLSEVPPVGPAIPDVATAQSDFIDFIAPLTISMTTSSLTAPCFSRVSGLTSSRFTFTSSE